MGFRFDFSSTLFPCEVKNKELIIYITDDYTRKFPVNMPDIPKNNCDFVGSGVSFLMIHDGIIWVGREDGTITGYRDTDICIKYQRKWVPGVEYVKGASRITGNIHQPVFMLDKDTNIGILPKGQKVAIFKEQLHIDSSIEYDDTLFGISLSDDVSRTFLRTREGRMGKDYEPDITWLSIPKEGNRVFLG